jgi:molybdopterin molybdotransferase
MKTYDEAATIISKAITRLDSIQLSIESASNYILAEDIISPIDVAPFRNSAMDGFAVAYEDIMSIPCTLPIRAISYAGDSESYTYKKMTALKIMTGAPLPDGYDTVIRVEDTSFNESEVTINAEITQFQNARMPGEDIKKGKLIYKSGQVINPLHIGIFASIGLNKLPVFRKPNILILSTGNELAEPGNPIKTGQIFNSNSFTLRSILTPFCQSITVDSILLDETEIVSKALSQNYDVIITSGGVSAGDKDLIPIMAERCGWIKKLHKVAIKPGKPIFFAQKDNQYLFGLPGNPLSTAVTCACFVIPALKKLIGVKDYRLLTNQAELCRKSIIKSGRTLIWPGNIIPKNGVLIACFASKKSSASLSALLNTDGLIFQYKTDDQPPRIEVSSWQQILNI